MFKIEEIRNLLLDQRDIEDINIREHEKYKNKLYEILIYCNLSTDLEWIPIVIGIPLNWKQNLVDVYLDIEDFPFIPHIDRDGKMCLYDLEGALIDWNFLGILEQCIVRAREIIILGLKGENKVDFLLEFNSYFSILKNCKKAKVSMPDIKKNKKIKYCNLTHGINSTDFFVSSELNDFKTWNIKSTEQNGIYFFIEPNEPIYPPDYNRGIDLEYLKSIFSYIEFSDFKKLCEKCRKECLMIFEIQQNNEITNCFGVLIKGAIFEYSEKISLIGFKELFPIVIERIDKSYIMNRTSSEDNLLKDKSYLLIGCGSIGGYVFYNLIKSGCENITVVDYDFLKEENIYRHLLGVELVGESKTKALLKYAKKTLPNLNIKSVNKKIEDVVKHGSIKFEEYDYIISATGNHNINRWINEYINEKRIETSVFYIWNEPLDIGSHVAYISFNNEGCYECFFSRSKEGELYDVTSYCEPKQKFVKSYLGCSETFIPYSSLISVKSATLFLDLLKKVIEGRVERNLLISEKGDDYYFKQAGLLVSEVYKNQNENIAILEGNKFVNCNCRMCIKNNEYSSQ